jgi:hypothetical protein
MPNPGDRYKKKTKDWFNAQGYVTEYVERVAWVGPAHKIPVRRDTFGADGLSIKPDSIVFWNSVLGKKNVSAHVREFQRWPYPKSVTLYVVVWEKGARVPELVNAREEIRQYVRSNANAAEN